MWGSHAMGQGKLPSLSRPPVPEGLLPSGWGDTVGSHCPPESLFFGIREPGRTPMQMLQGLKLPFVFAQKCLAVPACVPHSPLPRPVWTIGTIWSKLDTGSFGRASGRSDARRTWRSQSSGHGYLSCHDPDRASGCACSQGPWLPSLQGRECGLKGLPWVLTLPFQGEPSALSLCPPSVSTQIQGSGRWRRARDW